MSRWNCVGWMAFVACVTAAASTTFQYLDKYGSASVFKQCVKDNYCLRFRHESELVLPGSSPKGCGQYKLPALEELPRPVSISVPTGASDKEVVKLLLGYIENVLDHDQRAKQTLLKHYQSYLDACVSKMPASAPTN